MRRITVSTATTATNTRRSLIRFNERRFICISLSNTTNTNKTTTRHSAVDICAWSTGGLFDNDTGSGARSAARSAAHCSAVQASGATCPFHSLPPSSPSPLVPRALLPPVHPRCSLPGALNAGACDLTRASQRALCAARVLDSGLALLVLPWRPLSL